MFKCVIYFASVFFIGAGDCPLPSEIDVITHTFIAYVD